jgi:hypothetical protein
MVGCCCRSLPISTSPISEWRVRDARRDIPYLLVQAYDLKQPLQLRLLRLHRNRRVSMAFAPLGSNP